MILSNFKTDFTNFTNSTVRKTDRWRNIRVTRCIAVDHSICDDIALYNANHIVQQVDCQHCKSSSVLKFPNTLIGTEVTKPEGTGEEILLQGFNWDSWKHPGGWYNHIGSRAGELSKLGFTAIWLPPPTQSVSDQGYMPTDLYNLNSKYGSHEDLIKCIDLLHKSGMKAIGDAVLNHRCAQYQDENGVWNKYGGKLNWDSSAIVGDDPNFHGRGNKSSGQNFNAAPNIDHSQSFVKRDLQDWLLWLRTNVGFDGWRLDFARGFSGTHVRDYMEASIPQFSVGEYWDALSYDWDGTPRYDQNTHRQRIIDWIDSTGGLSTAFDFTLKGIMHAAFDRCEYWRLRDKNGKPPGVIGWWPARTVTFLDNHDTGSTQGHWRFPTHAIEQGYAYILTHPGTPCVFWDHLYDKKMHDKITSMISVRRRNGITCASKINIIRAERDVYTAVVEGNKGKKVLVKIGAGNVTFDDNWIVSECGNNWCICESKH